MLDEVRQNGPPTAQFVCDASDTRDGVQFDVLPLAVYEKNRMTSPIIASFGYTGDQVVVKH